MNTAPTQASVEKYGRIKIITYRLFLHKSADVGTKNTEVDIIKSNANNSEIISAECKFHNSFENDSDLQKHISKKIYQQSKQKKMPKFITGTFHGLTL